MLIIALGVMVNLVTLMAQVSSGGAPPSFSSRLKSLIQSEFIAPPDMQKLKAEDKLNDLSNKPFRVAEMIDVDYCIANTGTWDTLANGQKIWRLEIYSPDAQGLQFTYSNFNLPPGVQMYVYNEEKSFVIGAFTDQNNSPSGDFATEIIPGERCILELAISPYVVDIPRFCITQVGYVYRGIDYFLPDNSRLKATEAGLCHVNINCSPEGDNWKDVKRSVARIYMSGYFCSGNLLNNTALDFKNYFSTAFHCISGIVSTSSTWVFYFNYERSECSNSSTKITTNTITGAYVKAQIPIDGGGDGALLELKGTIPSSYNLYFAGWDRADSAVSNGVCIHHPQGDRMKISTIRNKWYSSTWHGADNDNGAENAHWYTMFSKTVNGYGTVEGGSSGSGLFGNDELFRGSLSGGSSSCDNPSGSNLFGKLSYNWDKYGNSSASQYKTWLDPSNTGAMRVRGIDPNNAAAFNVYWTSSFPTIQIDSTVKFLDETVGSNITRKWTFSGGQPSTSTIKNPVVKYAESGSYDVALEITYNGVKYTKTRTQYVFVKQKSAWILQNTHFLQPDRGIHGISIIDSLHVWAWAYNGIDPASQITEYCKTEDGGKNWKADSIAADTLKGYGIGNMFALNKDTIYASLFGPSGGGKILCTRDGGETWQVQTTALFNGTGSFPNFVYFFDKNSGICCGDPSNGYFEIYKTADGGTHWVRVSQGNIPANQTDEMGTTNMYDCKGGVFRFGTSAGRVYRSDNQGSYWTVTSTGLTGQTAVKFKNADVGFAVVTGTNFGIKKTESGGTYWVDFVTPTDFLKGDLIFVPGTTGTWLNFGSGWLSGSSYTINDGLDFTSLDEDISYTAVAFYDEYTGWAGSFNVDSITGGIYKWDKTNALLTANKEIEVGQPVDRNWQIYPNPVQNSCVVSTKKNNNDASGFIINLQGKCMHQFPIPASNGGLQLQLNLVDLPAGVYMLQINGSNFTENLRFVKL